MATPYAGELRLFAGSFAPDGWLFCHGQLLPISENDVLFSLIGTTYGGNGETHFALPDLQGRMVLSPGQRPGLSPRVLGEAGGSETVTLPPGQAPAHSHALVASASATSASPAGKGMSPAVSAGSTAVPVYRSGSNQVAMAADAVAAFNGGGQPHNNLQPYLTLNFCISLLGVYPRP